MNESMQNLEHLGKSIKPKKKKRGLAFSSQETKTRVGKLGGTAPHKRRGPKKGIKLPRFI